MPPPSEPQDAGAGKRPKRGAGEDSDKGAAKGAAKPRRCPICGRPAAPETLPFCSPRCRDVDLNRWLSGSYVIPARDDEPDDLD